MAYPPEQAGLS
jgi:ABC-type sugar transport system ATPase subunit